MKRVLAALAVTALTATTAHAATINFDSLVGPGGVGPSSGNGFTDSGFVFSTNMDALDLTNWCYGSCSGHSGNYGALNNYGGAMTMTQQGGGTFSVQDLWLRDWYGNGGSATVSGLLGGVEVGTVTVSLDSVWRDVVLNLPTVDTLRIGTSNIFTIDDIRVNGNAVPEPAGLALASLGLAGAAFARRRRQG